MFNAAYCRGAIRQVHQIGPIITNLSYFEDQGAKLDHKCVQNGAPKQAPSTTPTIPGARQNIWVYGMWPE